MANQHADSEGAVRVTRDDDDMLRSRIPLDAPSRINAGITREL